MGRTTSEGKMGDHGADELPVAGAASHRVPSELVTPAQKQRKLEKRVQQMMVNMLLEQHRQEHSFEKLVSERPMMLLSALKIA